MKEITEIPEQLAQGTVEQVGKWTLTAEPERISEGGLVILTLRPPTIMETLPDKLKWEVEEGELLDQPKMVKVEGFPVFRRKWDTTGLRPSTYRARVLVNNLEVAAASIKVRVRPLSRGDTLAIQMRRAVSGLTPDQALWVVIRNSTQAISFQGYQRFITTWMRCPPKEWEKRERRCDKPTSSSTPFPFVHAYRTLKEATELFLMCYCGVAIDFGSLIPDLHEESLRFGQEVTQDLLEKLWEDYLVKINQDKILPYLDLIRREKLTGVGFKDQSVECYGILREKLLNPCLIELIWAYWLEEGMLVNTLNAVSLRFQNRRLRPGPDPLARLDLDALRPLNNLLWGYIQDEQHRLTLTRRAYEYEHHYGLRLMGQLHRPLETVDSRSKFLEAFHNLLYVTSVFYQQDDDTMVMADGFPVLNGLKEVHLLLAEGAHNQFGDLPSTARMEMLMMQWLLARPEMREFLSSRIMVPYPEAWMDRVDTMKKLQGWHDVSIIHFRDLAVYGEQILLSIRYGSWIEVNHPEAAANWARYWRPEIQRYIHAYRAVTGVDLTSEATDPQQTRLRYLPPGVHLRQRLARLTQQRF